jgi:hypothetical protein
MKKTSWILILVAIVAVTGINTFFAAGCGDAENPPAADSYEQDSGTEPEQNCVPGVTQRCWCVVGSYLEKGAQTCAEDGMSWT